MDPERESVSCPEETDMPHEDRGKWWQERVSVAATTSPVPLDPSDTWLGLFAEDLDQIGCRVCLLPGGRRFLSDPDKRATPRIREILSKHGDRIVSFLIRSGRLANPPAEQVLPKPNTVVEWADGEGFGGLCVADELPAKPWVRWRYKRQRTWHGFTGETWDE